ncbi:MAG TPA: thiamine pyrophosphate-dependent dehydrogenase E1 component subunit alpha [Actinomycetota bacterium]
MAKVESKATTAEDWRAGLSDDRLKEVLHLLKLCRYFDERMEALYRQGRLPGAIYSGRGQEGTHVGVAYALREDDSLFPTHRDLSAQLTKGLDLQRVMAQFWGRIDGYTRGRDGNSHIGDWSGNRTWTVMSHLPIAYPVACGAALAYQRREEPRVAMAICGDGATSNGRWHEALNVSAVFRLPVVWVVNNNQYAYSTPNRLEFPVPTIAERAAAYGMPGVRVDAQDVLDVYRAASEAVERARAGDGPTLLECLSLRWRGHAGHDPAKYVPKEMLEEYMTTKDPVRRFEELLRSREILSEADVAEMDERIRAAFEAGYEFALSSPFPEPGDVTKGLYTDDGYWVADAGRAGGTEAG